MTSNPWPFLLLLTLLSTSAEAAQLTGKVLDSDPDGLPVAGVEVRAEGATSVLTDGLGLFTLDFPTRQPGEVVGLSLVKQGYQVVNAAQLQATLPAVAADEPLTLLLCQPSLCDELLHEYYRRRAIAVVEASYERRRVELEQRGQVSNEELDRLRQERDDVRDAAEEISRSFSVSNLVSAFDFSSALRSLAEGELDQALAVVDEATLASALEAARAQAETAAFDTSRAIDGYILRAQLLTLQLRFDAAEQTYQTAVAGAPDSFDACYALASFAVLRHRYEQATTDFHRCLELAKAQRSARTAATTLFSLGDVLGRQNRLDQARNAYDAAVGLYRRMVEAGDSIYLASLAKTLSSLGILLAESQPLEARKAYDEAQAVYRQLAEGYPDGYLPHVATTLFNLGVLLGSQGQTAEARQSYGEALAILRQLVEKNPDRHLPTLAKTLNNQGLLLGSERRSAEAREAFDATLAVYRQLAEKSPETYLPSLARTLNNLGFVLTNEERTAEASEVYAEAIVTWRQLAEKAPRAYLSDLAATLKVLGTLLTKQDRLEEARTTFTEAADAYRRLAETEPGVRADLALVLNNLGVIDFNAKRWAAARPALEEALKVRKQLAAQNAASGPEVAETLTVLAYLHAKDGRTEQARQSAREALAIYTPAAASDPAIQQRVEVLEGLLAQLRARP